ADLPDQNYTVQVEAVDRAGNTGTAATHATLAVDEGGGGIGASLMSWVQDLISSSKKKEQQKEEKMKPFSSEIINLLIFIVLMVVGGIATYWLVSSNVDY
ncbi:MAG: hypothetical protein SVU32_01385, partial [Candidatus Nanohaloarchaea archaeon]|nr:hypothetical protein [Candidatus Nanohaloarchaea archaeon]